MAQWVNITESDLLEYISGEELSRFRRANTRPGEGDPVGGVIRSTTDLVRAHILQCARYKLGRDGTIPVVLMDPACQIAVVKIMSRAGGTVIDQSGERKKASDDAKRLLRDVAKGNGLNIQLPDADDGVGTEQAPPGIIAMQYTAPTDEFGNQQVPTFGWPNQEGI